MTIVAFLCFSTLIAAWFVAPKEKQPVAAVPALKATEAIVPATS
jgi:hypothetical protein